MISDVASRGRYLYWSFSEGTITDAPYAKCSLCNEVFYVYDDKALYGHEEFCDIGLPRETLE